MASERQKHESGLKKLKDKIKELEHALAEENNQCESLREAITSLEQKVKV
jgi:chromosome segregation ATPase